MTTLSDVAVAGTTTDAQWSLREAISHANADSESDVDKIEFSASLHGGTIQLSSSLGYLWIASDVELVGLGQDALTIDGQGFSRVLLVSSGAHATISDLTITGGNVSGLGGGILAQGDLELEGVRITGNSASSAGGGIYAFGQLTVLSSTIDDNEVLSNVGGGISLDTTGRLTMRNSTVDNNRATYGAGLYASVGHSDSLTIETSTFSNNNASSIGGAILIQKPSGATGTVGGSFVNSTISGNESAATGGVRVSYGAQVDFLNATIANNTGDYGGGLAVMSSTVTLHNTIVATNKNNSSVDHDVYGTLQTASSHNLFGAGGSGGLSATPNSNIILSAGQSAGLAPLADNNGPTKTHALLNGSPALDAGSNSAAIGLSVDQRGRNRFVASANTTSPAIDIGAYERGLVVSTAVDELDSDYTNGDLSLREALTLAYAQSGLNEITFNPFTSPTILLNSSLGYLWIASDVELVGLGQDALTIDGQGFSRVLLVSSGAHATISDLTITGGNVSGLGGGVLAQGDLELEGVRITGNSASSAGGGIYAFGQLTILSSMIDDNEVLSNVGGGISLDTTGRLTMRTSTVDNNRATYGAGLYASVGHSDSLTIEASTFSNNNASSIGGAILIQKPSGATGTVGGSFVNSTISGNESAATGGVRVSYGAQVDFLNATIANNTGDYGGGLAVMSSTVTLHNTIVAENKNNAGVDHDVYGTLQTASSHNLVGDGSGGLIPNLGNILGTSSQSVSPLLGPLNDNDGVTKSHGLLINSPALDAGTESIAPSLDQRAHLRPIDLTGYTTLGASSVDIGAFEAGNPTHLVVTTLDDENDALDAQFGNGPDLSLREALAYVANNANKEIITFSEDLFRAGPKTMHLAYDANLDGVVDPLIVDQYFGVLIDGPGRNLLTIHGEAGDSIFAFIDRFSGGPSTVELRDMTLTGGGGGISWAWNEGSTNLVITSVDIVANYGNAISWTRGNLTLVDTQVKANAGHAIYGDMIDLTIVNSEIAGNEFGVWLYLSSASIAESTIADNRGTAVDVTRSTVDITNSTIANNISTTVAAGIQTNFSSSATLRNVTIVGNRANAEGLAVGESGTGGGAYTAALSNISLYNCIVVGNWSGSQPSQIPSDLGSFEGFFQFDQSSHNLIGVGHSGLLANAPGPGNELNVSTASLALAPLGYYGGATRTLALLPNSIAIDRGGDDVATDVAENPLTTDQRNQRRFVDFDGNNGPDSVDIGAFELEGRVISAADEADFNRDGRADEVFFDPKTGNLNILLSLGDHSELSSWGKLPSAVAGSVTFSDNAFFVGDFNGDGRDDLMARNAADGHRWTLALSESNRFAFHPLTTLSGAPVRQNWSHILVGDFDGDGSDEMAGWDSAIEVSGAAGLAWEVMHFDEALGTRVDEGLNAWGQSPGFVPAVGSLGHALRDEKVWVVDVNRDGRDDLVAYNDNSEGYQGWMVGLSTKGPASGSEGNLFKGANHFKGLFGGSWTTWFDAYYTPSSKVLQYDAAYADLLEAFESVYNNVELELYPGLMKGPTATAATRAGNDWDQAALLASKIPAQYEPKILSAQITVPLTVLKEWVGAKELGAVEKIIKASLDPNAAPVLLTGSVAALQFRHAFVQVTVPTATGLTTQYVDPSWKFKDYQDGIAPIAFDEEGFIKQGAQFFDTGIGSEFRARQLPLEFYEDEISKSLAGTGKSLAEQQYKGIVVQRKFTQLPPMAYTPASLSLAQSYPDIISSSSETLTHRVRISFGQSFNIRDWTWTAKVPDVSTKSLNVEIRGSASSYTASLLVDGEVVLASTLVGGNKSVFIEILNPGESPITYTPGVTEINFREVKIDWTNRPNETLAIALGASQISASELDERLSRALSVDLDTDLSPDDDGIPDVDDVADMLAYGAAKYWFDVDSSAQHIADSTHTLRTQGVHAAILSASGTVVPQAALADTPFGIFTTDLRIDAYRMLNGQTGAYTTFGTFENHREGAGTFVDVSSGDIVNEAVQLYSLQYSSLEHSIIESLGGTEAVSVPKLLQMAYAGVPQISDDNNNPLLDRDNYLQVLEFAVVTIDGEQKVQLRHSQNWASPEVSVDNIWGTLWTSETTWTESWTYDALTSGDINPLLTALNDFMRYEDPTSAAEYDGSYPSVLRGHLAAELLNEVEFVRPEAVSRLFIPRSRIRVGFTGSGDSDYWQGGGFYSSHPDGHFHARFFSSTGDHLDGGASSGIDALLSGQSAARGNNSYLHSQQSVAPANGNALRAETDILFPNIGIPLSFGRTYNSQSSLTFGSSSIEANVGLGTGWTHSFSDRLYYFSGSASTPDLLWHTSTGEQHYFKYENGGYTTPPELIGAFGLVTGTTDQFWYLDHDGTEIYFQKAVPSAGPVIGQAYARLLKKVDFNHQGITVSYVGATTATDGTAYRLSAATDINTSNRGLGFSYNSSGLIASVDKFVNGPTNITATWSYSYATVTGLSDPNDSGKRLESVTSPVDPLTVEGPVVRLYSYYGSSDPSYKRGLLKRNTDPNSDYREYEYYFNKRVARLTASATTSEAGPTTVSQSYAYNLFAHKTEVFDERGNIETYVHQANGLTLREIHADRSRVAYTWDPNTATTVSDYLITSRTDENGAVQTYSYWADTNATKGRELYETTAPHFVDDEGEVVDPSKLLVTRFDYIQPANRPHIRRATSVLVDPDPGNQNLETTFLYDDIGRLLGTIDPLGNTTAFSYHTNGLVEYVFSPEAFDSGPDRDFIVYRALGSPDISSGTLTVRLPAAATGSVQADSIRIDRIGDIGSSGADYTGTFVLDDASSGFSISGTGATTISNSESATGLVGDSARKFASGSDAVATWQFVNLPPGKYRVSVSIADVTGDAATASYNVYDGSATPANLKLTQSIDQDGVSTPTNLFATHWSYFTYDAAGNVASTQADALPFSSATQFDHNGRPILATDRSGISTEFVFDVLGRLRSSALDPNGTGPLQALSSTFAYDKSGQLVSGTDPLGHTGHVAYDLRGRVVERTNADGSAIHNTYDEAGNLIEQTDELGRVTRTIYDNRNRPIQVIYADGASERLRYDGVGRVSAMVDANGRETRYTYDASGRLESTTNAKFDTSTNHYDVLGRLERTIDYRGVNTVYRYDAVGRVVETRVEDEATPSAPPLFLSTVDYDRNGNIVRTAVYDVPRLAATTAIPANPRDLINSHPQYVKVVETKYDSFNRAVETVYRRGNSTGTADVATRTFFDGDGRARFAVDELGRYVEFAYDEYGRLKESIQPDPTGSTPADKPVTTVQYDAAGNIIAVTDANDHMTATVYDALNRPVQVTDAEGNVTRYQYDVAGQLIAAIDALGRAAYREYDSRGRLQLQSLPDPDVGNGVDAAPVTRYAYDAAGNLIARIDPRGYATTFEYDELNRLRSESSVTEEFLVDNGDAGFAVNKGNGALQVDAAAFGGDATLISPTATPSTEQAEGLWVFENLPAGTYRIAAALRGHVQAGTTVAASISDYSPTLLPVDFQATVSQQSPSSDIVRSENEMAMQWTILTEEFIVPAQGPGKIAVFLAGTDRLPLYVDAVRVERIATKSFDYDANGNLETETDALGRVTSYQYDELGRVNKITYPDPDADTNSGGPSETDLPSPETIFNYDGFGNVISTTELRGAGATVDRVTEQEYDKRNRLVSATYAVGTSEEVTTTYHYDDVGNLKTMTEASGSTEAVVTRYDYDNLNRLSAEYLDAAIATAWKQKTQYRYDAVGNVTRSEITIADAVDADESSTVTTFAYDDIDRLITQVRDAEGTAPELETTQRIYDHVGNLLAVVDSTDRSTEFQYDRLNRLIRSTSSAPDQTGIHVTPTVSYSYDVSGNLVAQTNAEGETSRTMYDARGRQSATIDGAGNQTRYTYDDANNLIAVVDSEQNKTSFTYDGLNRLTSETAANSLEPRLYVYDCSARLAQTIDRELRVREYSYDALGRLEQEQWFTNAADMQADSTLSWEYDVLGRVKLSKQTNALNNVLYVETTDYDHLGRVIEHRNYEPGQTAVNPQAKQTISHDIVNPGAAFVASSLTQTVNSQAIATTSYAVDRLGRLTTIVDDVVSEVSSGKSDKQIALGYDAAGRLESIARSSVNGSFSLDTSYHFDGAGRLDSIEHTRDNEASPAASFTYRYDGASRIAQTASRFSYSDVKFSRLETFAYDEAGRLTSATGTHTNNGAPGLGFDVDNVFTLDGAGNRETTSVNGSSGTSAQINPNNQLVEDGTYTFVYDAEGNLQFRRTNGGGPETEYSWDHRNRLIQVIQRATEGGIELERVAYRYNNSDLRVRRDAFAGVSQTLISSEYFVYDGDQVSMVVDGAGKTRHRYLNGPGTDFLLVDEVFSSAGQAERGYWAVTDHLGTVHELIESDADGDATATNHNLVAHLDYDVSGRIARAIDRHGVAIAFDSLPSDFAFAGREWDGDAGLYYNRARWYDANSGRFISEDPVGFAGGDANVYRYAAGDPVNYFDPSGLSWLSSAFRKVEREVDRAFDDASREVSRVGHQVDDFVNENGGWGTWAIVAATVAYTGWAYFTIDTLPPISALLGGLPLDASFDEASYADGGAASAGNGGNSGGDKFIHDPMFRPAALSDYSMPPGTPPMSRREGLELLDRLGPPTSGYRYLDMGMAFFHSIGISAGKAAVILDTYWDDDVQEERIQSIMRRNDVIRGGGEFGSWEAGAQHFALLTTDEMAYGGVGYDPMDDRELDWDERAIRFSGGMASYSSAFIPVAAAARAVPVGAFNPRISFPSVPQTPFSRVIVPGPKPSPPLASVLEGHGPEQGFTGVYDANSGGILIRPSTAAAPLPHGWVPRARGHANVSAALGGDATAHSGFAVILQKDGSLAVTWRSGTLNAPPNYVVPPSLRPKIIEAIQDATGRTVKSP